MQIKLTKFTKVYTAKVSTLFGKKELDTLARETGFMQRKRKLTPRGFLDTIMCGAYGKDESTLITHVTGLGIDHGIDIRPQSFDKHFNQRAVDFVKAIIEKQFGNQLSGIVTSQKFLDRWERVILHDSTQFRLPGRLKHLFKGFGGNLKCDSIFKVQNAYDLKQGAIQELEVGDARLQDATSGKKVIPKCKEGDLLIRDLGYFELDGFNKMECDYVSRLKAKTIIYDMDGKKLDLKKLQRKMAKDKTAYMDMPVTLGTKKKVKTRIIITLAPKEVKDGRIRKANKQNKSYGNKTSDDFKLYAGFNFYITNVDREELSADQIMALYRIRWQIELMFKSWKSCFKLHVSKDCNPYRVLCYVYSSLLLILINWELASLCMKLAHEQNGKPSSMLKAMKGQLMILASIRKWVKGDLTLLAMDIGEYFLSIHKHISLNKRNKRRNYIDIIGEIDN